MVFYYLYFFQFYQSLAEPFSKEDLASELAGAMEKMESVGDGIGKSGIAGLSKELAEDPFFSKRAGTASGIGGRVGKITDVTRTAQISNSKGGDRFFFGLESATGTAKKKGVLDTDRLVAKKGLEDTKQDAEALQTHDKIDRLRALVESKNR